EHGADIVVHSATKYLGGHDDVTLGLVVSARHEMHRALWKSSVDLGVAADPFAAWLTVRGLKTLALRMARHCANAAFLAERLVAHPAVAAVHWPGLDGHPDHAVARRLLSGYGGMVAVHVTRGARGGWPRWRRRWAAWRPWCCIRPPPPTGSWTRPGCAPRASARGASASRSGWNTPRTSGRTSSRPWRPPGQHDRTGGEADGADPRRRPGGRAIRLAQPRALAASRRVCPR